MNEKDIKSIRNKYRVNPIIHTWKVDPELVFDAVEDFGYGGVVTNVKGGNGYIENPENIEELAAVTEAAARRGLEYWVYDEVGYPSGQANGLTLKGHPELKAKGLYMRKFEAYLAPMNFEYVADETADEVVYAVKYKMDLSSIVEAVISFDSATPLEFSGKTAKIELEQGEVGYVFVARNGYEGTHAVHNVSSRKEYINLLSEEAVERFLEVAYDPLARYGESIFTHAKAIFTDEPSLMTALARPYETINYALIPYEKTLFDKFEARYGFDIKPLLPLLYEDTNERCYDLRVKFYELIGEIIAKNYSGRIDEYCRAHGTVFSGHYLAEEHVVEHVMDYGNYVKVLLAAGYPGMDILQVTPEDFFFTAPKYLQMIARKKGSDGFMVELCPFFNTEVFNRKPFENAIGGLSILLAYGARKINTYYQPRLKDYAPELDAYDGSTDREQSRYLNEYVSGICAALDGRKPIFDTYVYYAIEDVQAKFVPICSGRYDRDMVLTKYDRSIDELCKKVLLSGGEFGIADADDVLGGLSGRIVVPEVDYIRADVAEALKNADVYFIGDRPKVLTTSEKVAFGTVLSADELAEALKESSDFVVANGILRQSYEGGAIVFYNNNTESASVIARRPAEIYDPDRGRFETVKLGEGVVLKPYRAVVAFYKD